MTEFAEPRRLDLLSTLCGGIGNLCSPDRISDPFDRYRNRYNPLRPFSPSLTTQALGFQMVVRRGKGDVQAEFARPKGNGRHPRNMLYLLPQLGATRTRPPRAVAIGCESLGERGSALRVTPVWP